MDLSKTLLCSGIIYSFKEHNKINSIYRCKKYKSERCSAKIFKNNKSGDYELKGEHTCS